MGDQHGQASVELLAGLPVLLLTGLLCLQLLVAGYSLSLADGAAEAGAIALASDLPPQPAVRGALPGWAHDRVEVRAVGGRIAVSVRPPSPVAAVGRALEVTSTAWVRLPDSGGAAR